MPTQFTVSQFSASSLTCSENAEKPRARQPRLTPFFVVPAVYGTLTSVTIEIGAGCARGYLLHIYDADGCFATFVLALRLEARRSAATPELIDCCRSLTVGRIRLELGFEMATLCQRKRASGEQLVALISRRSVRVFCLVGNGVTASQKELTPVCKTDDEGQDRHWVALGDFDSSGNYLVASCDGRNICLWDTATWERRRVWSAKRRLSALLFSATGQHVLTTDKAGDVYRYHIEQDGDEASGEPLLGHISVILDLAVAPNGQCVLTADRDEKIRVSHYPNAYNIAAFCLGHTSFVGCVTIPSQNDKLAISGSGDGTLRVWNYCCGELQQTVSIPKQLVPSCIACSPVSPLVAVGLHETNAFSLYQLVSGELSYLTTVQLDASVVHLMFDQRGNLWLLLAQAENALRVLDGSALQHGQVTDIDLPRELSGVLTDVEFFKDCAHSRLDLDLLSKEPYDAGQRYFERKEQRLQDAAKASTKQE